MVVVAIVTSTMEVVGWWWGLAEVGWRFVAAGGGHCHRSWSCH